MKEPARPPERMGAVRQASTGNAPAWTEGKLALRAQQQWFAAIVSTPQDEPAPVDERSALRLVTASATLSSLERIDIYRRGYHARLIECLVDDYPVLEHALGAEAFEALSRRYIARYPSSGPSLNYFGQLMADFVATSRWPSRALPLIWPRSSGRSCSRSMRRPRTRSASKT